MPRKRFWKSQDGAIELHHSDCFAFLEHRPELQFAAVVTDPPYGSTDCAWDKCCDLDAWWKLINQATPPTAVVASFAAQPFATDMINSNRRGFRYELVWEKTRAVGFLNANRQPLRAHELILVFCRRPGSSVYHPQKTKGKPYKVVNHGGSCRVYARHVRRASVNHGDRHPRSVLAIDEPGRGRWHPTQKPVALCEWLVLSYSNAGDTVFDPFMGSASTAVACARTGRRFVGCERDPENFERAVERLRLEQAQSGALPQPPGHQPSSGTNRRRRGSR